MHTKDYVVFIISIRNLLFRLEREMLYTNLFVSAKKRTVTTSI